MSTVHDIIAELNAGEEARRKVPELEAAIASMNGSVNTLSNHNQALELKCMDYRNEIDALRSKVRSLEVERDDAGFRELEATDKLATLLRVVRAATNNLDETADGFDPADSLFEKHYQERVKREGAFHEQASPKPEPVTVPITEGQSEPLLTADSTSVTAPVSISAVSSETVHSHGVSEPPKVIDWWERDKRSSY